jgi:hypothetical protein
MILNDKHQLTALAYATKHVHVLRIFPCINSNIQQQAFVYAASNGSLAALEFILTDHNYASVDINGLDSIHGETGSISSRFIMFVFCLIRSYNIFSSIDQCR